MATPRMTTAPLPTPITRDTALLIFIDLQTGPLSTIRSMDAQELTQNALALARAARLLQLPVILAGAAVPGPGGTFLPELVSLVPEHQVITHATNNAWETPEFVAAVIQSKRTTLIFAGIATDVGLCLPAISAARAGYAAYAVIDVSGTLNARIEQAAWLRMAMAGVALTSWTALVGEIQHDYTRDPGPQLRALIGERLNATQGPFAADLPHHS